MKELWGSDYYDGAVMAGLDEIEIILSDLNKFNSIKIRLQQFQSCVSELAQALEREKVLMEALDMFFSAVYSGDTFIIRERRQKLDEALARVKAMKEEGK